VSSSRRAVKGVAPPRTVAPHTRGRSRSDVDRGRPSVYCSVLTAHSFCYDVLLF
jgi:hypothetical protein